MVEPKAETSVKIGKVTKKSAPKSPQKRTKAVVKNASQKQPPAKLAKQRSAQKLLAKAKKAGTAKAGKSSANKKPRHPNDKLKPNPNVTLYDKRIFEDPTFEMKEEIPWISVEAYSRLPIRAVLMNNEALLKRLIDDTKHVSSVHKRRSIADQRNAVMYAIENGNWKLIDMLCQDQHKPKQNRVQELPSLLQTAGTGQFNFHMLGHGVRQIQMTRGGKEGNNALLQDSNAPYFYGVGDMTEVLIRDVDIGTIQRMITKGYINQHMVNQHIYQAVRYGHRKLAGKLIELYGYGGFNDLHKEVLMNDKQNLKQFKPISVKKKGMLGNKSMNPVHCACTNPNEKYLEALIQAEPDYNTPDDENRRPLHYAAGCESTGPMKVLLKKGASLYDVDKQGNLPLHVAAQTGRDECLNLLCEEMTKTDKLSLNRKSRIGFAPIHLAAQNGHLSAVKILVKHGADFELQTGAARKKMTALMFAAEYGQLHIVKWLVESQNAIVDKRDKLKRTALISAIMNGHAPVASYLLRIGANPDLPDSSGNTPTHYATAYGWYFCLKVLMEAEAHLNESNDWKLTPLAVAYMKGHMGLADLLLKEESIDINCQDEKGLTLVSLTLSNVINKSTIDQLSYLIKDKKADCTIPDSMGNNALHHLASATYQTQTPSHQQRGRLFADQAERKKEEEKATAEMAQLLIDNGCNANHANEEKRTPMMLAITTGKIKLAELLFKHGGCLPTDDITLNGVDNVLHNLAKHPTSVGGSLLALLAKKQPVEVSKLLSSSGSDGYTPLLRAIQLYGGTKTAATHTGRGLFGFQQPQQDDQSVVLSHQKDLRNFIKEILNFSPQCLMQQVGKEALIISHSEEENDEEDEDEDEYESSNEDDEETGIRDAGKKLPGDAKLTDQNQTAFHLAVNAESKLKEMTESRPLLQLIVAVHASNKQIWSDKKGRKILEIKDGNFHTPLMTAVFNGDSVAAKMLLKARADADTCITRPLEVPDLSKMVSDAQLMSKKRAEEDAPNNVTILMKSVQMKMKGVVNAVLEAGASIHHTDSNGDTALHYAARDSSSDMAEIMELLLRCGGSPHAANAKHRIPLHLACNADTGSADVSTELVELLLSYKSNPLARDIRSRIPLHYAFVKIGNYKNTSEVDPVALCQVLLKKMENGHPDLLVGDIYSRTALHYAANRGSNICVMTMLRHSPQLLDRADSDQNKALGLAIFNGHMACTLTLIQANADIRSTINKWGDGKFDTPDEWMQMNKWKWGPFREKLLELKHTPYSNAIVRNEWQGIVYVVLDLMESNPHCLTDLTKAAIEYRKYNLALTLLRMIKFKSGPKQNQTLSPSNYEQNLFYLLATSATSADTLQIKVAEVLQSLGVPTRDSNGNPRVAIEAARKHNFLLLDFLRKQDSGGLWISNFDGSYDGLTPLSAMLYQWNASMDSVEFKKWMLELSKDSPGNLPLGRYPVPFDPTDQKGRSGFCTTGRPSQHYDTTMLIRAVELQNFYLCKFLIQKLQVDVNVADPTGITPIMMAVKINNINIIKLILNHKHEIPKGQVGYEEGEEECEQDDDDDGVPHGRVFGGGLFGAAPVPKSQFSADTIQLAKHMASEENQENDEADEAEENSENEDDNTEAADPDSSNRKRKRKSRKAKFSKAKKAKKTTNQYYFRKTSNVDLMAKDNNHRSVIHHCVMPFEWGAWENTELVSMLVKYGAPVKSLDINHKTPLDYAIERGQKAMADRLKSLTKSTGAIQLQYDQFKITRSKSFGPPQQKSITDEDIDKHAEEYLEAEADKRKKKQEEIGKDAMEKLEREPNHLSGYEQTGELMKCNETGHMYKVLLNKVDVQFGAFGYYNFYRMELIKRKGTHLYIVFTNWGRIGDPTGQYQRTPFGKLEDAEKEFRSIFRSKTGNDWNQVNNFAELPKKYKLIQRDKSLEAGGLHELNIDLDSTVKPTLPKEIEIIIKNISDVKGLKQNTRLVNSGFQFMMPFGRIARERILAARDKLKEICENIVDLDKMRQNVHERGNLEKAQRIMNDLCSLSNDFHELLPFGGMSHRAVPVIDTLHTLKEFSNAVHNLLEFEVAGKILAAAAAKKKQINPMDYILGSLKTDIQVIDPDSHDAQYILHYIHNSSTNSKVERIFKVVNNEQNGEFDPKDIGNRKLLWHGTSAANMLSILKLGLLSAPPQAIHHGYLFGKGIYTADVFEKSLGYCQSHSGSQTKYILLCEVALGKTLIPSNYADQQLIGCVQTHKGHDSIKMLGQQVPDPAYDVTLPTGARVSLSNDLVQPTLEKNQYAWVSYNEYIVYDPKQVVIRYVVALK